MHDALSPASAPETLHETDRAASGEVALITAPISAIPVPRVTTLSDLHSTLRLIESRENPDTVLPLSELRATEHGLISIPGHGGFALTAWARRQLAERLGIKWDRWFALLEGAERAAEINLRLGRSRDRVRVRTATFQDAEHGDEVPTLRAFVTESYSPFSDALLVEMLGEVIDGAERSVARLSVTDMTVTYTLTVGRPFRPGDDARVGDLQGGILVRNSGVGYAGLNASAHLERLVCLNGMLLPIADPTLLACIHRGVDAAKVRAKLVERARAIGGTFVQGAERLLEGRRYRVDDREAIFLAVLKRARAPKKGLEALEAAYLREPEASAFGVVQAVTRASQDFAPEVRYELERAAALYLAELGAHA